MENITPMLKQYQSIKAHYKDCILFFRLGDFYEMFYEDAQKASAILNVVLTSRDAGKSGKAPMCGIPYHAVDSYVLKLIKAGLKVAICEQVEDPSMAKGIVKREVIRVITSGTYIDENASDARYLLCIFLHEGNIGIAFTDASSGVILTNQYSDKKSAIEVIARLPLYECMYALNQETSIKEIFKHPFLKIKNTTFSPCEDWSFNAEIADQSLREHFSVHSVRGFGLDDKPLAVTASGALLEYMKRMNQQPLRHIDKLSLYTDDEYVFISPVACLGLELEELSTAIDRTLTPAGKRRFKEWLYRPLKKPEQIKRRQDAVTLLKDTPNLQQEIYRLLRNMPDIDKSLSRISGGCAQAKDLLALRSGLSRIPDLQKALEPLSAKNQLIEISDEPAIRKLLTEAIDPELSLSHPGGKIIRPGYNQELDGLRDIQENGRQWLKNLQAAEIQRTGIHSLKIGFTQVFGYYLEISKSNLGLVPPHYIRKQTLANAERFVIPELMEFEEKMLTADENVLKIESVLLKEIYKELLDHSVSLHLASASIAALDALYSLSILALSPGYTLPEISADTQISITDGRHPIVEHVSSAPFVPNDTLLDCEYNHLVILTGPNMAGKSTYIRQNAILVIMAQMGSYLPASSALIGIVDKIFTRIGSHDEITKGQSTFMVEMSETASILNNLSQQSLVILDEIGRGTSTYDGLSLAWAVAEYLQKKKVRTFFATHFHELTALAEEHAGVKNYNVAVKEWNDEIIFLHKIVSGGSDQSYGIYVAKLAGIPKEVVQRSTQILSRLEMHGSLQEKIRNQQAPATQLTLFPHQGDVIEESIIDELQDMDADGLTPLSALNKLHEWKDKLEAQKEKAK